MIPPPPSGTDDSGNQEVSIPLFSHDDDDDDGQPSTSSRRDVRFAIDDEHAEEEEEEANDQDVLITSSKYPPTTATPDSLPPSYRQAVYKKDPWYKSEVALSLQHYGRICFSSVAMLFAKYWPTSRFAQAGFFIVGLWIIVIVTGPTWDKSAKLGWGKSVDDFLASIPPPPVSGDGHFVSLADWSLSSCTKTAPYYCHRSSIYKLHIPTVRDAFSTSDKIFIFADPIRSNIHTDERGNVPTSIKMILDPEMKEKEQVKVVVRARYHKEMEPLLERANVGEMKAGLVDQGVGIYTWPLPPKLAELTQKEAQQFPYPLLSFDIDLHVEPHSRIPNFVIEGAQMDVGLFTEPKLSTSKAPNHKRDREEVLQLSDATREKLSHARHERDRDGDLASEQTLQLSEATREKLSHARFGHAIGLARQKRQPASASADSLPLAGRQLAPPSSVPAVSLPHTIFGSLTVKSGLGNISIADNVDNLGILTLNTKQGNIDVASSTSIRGGAIYLETKAGQVTIGPQSTLEARDNLQVISRNGSVSIQDGVRLSGTRVNGEAPLGTLSAAQATWTSNHTLVFKSQSDLTTLIGITPPFRPALGVGTEQHPWVSVDSISTQGSTNLTFVNQVRNTPLRGKFTSEKDVTLALHQEYFGSFSLSSGSHVQVIPPDSKKEIKTKTMDRSRIFESDGKKGQIWWKENGKGSTPPTGEEWGGIQVESKKGKVVLGFDAVS
ncbi:unnamed protein product [Sympodiomycopsis kandeliae]